MIEQARPVIDPALALMPPESRKRVRVNNLVALMKGQPASKVKESKGNQYLYDGLRLDPIALGVLDDPHALKNSSGRTQEAWQNKTVTETIAQAVEDFVSGTSIKDTEHRRFCGRYEVSKTSGERGPQITGGELSKHTEFQEIRPAAWALGDIKYPGLTQYLGAASFTRQDFINADWARLGLLTTEMINAAHRSERGDIIELVALNPVMADDKAQFHVDRANLVEASVLDDESLASLFAALRGLKTPQGTGMNLRPTWLLTNPDHEIALRKILKASDLQDVVKLFFDSRIPKDELTLLPDPSHYPVYGFLHLENSDEPSIRAKQDFKTDSIQIIGEQWVGSVPMSANGARLRLTG